MGGPHKKNDVEEFANSNQYFQAFLTLEYRVKYNLLCDN